MVIDGIECFLSSVAEKFLLLRTHHNGTHIAFPYTYTGASILLFVANEEKYPYGRLFQARTTTEGTFQHDGRPLEKQAGEAYGMP